MVEQTTRGCDHIGLTVPDIMVAERFITDGLGGELLYELLGSHQRPLAGPAVEAVVGLPPGAEINVVRMYRIGNGPGIELFQYTAAGQREAARACDVGWQHIAFYVDDLEAAIARAEAAGGTLMGPPWDLMGPERGTGNRFCFIRTPFGALLELVTCPSPLAHPAGTRRWKPPA